MTNKQIFKKIIQRAEKNGFDIYKWYEKLFGEGVSGCTRNEILSWLNSHIDSFGLLLIFDHDFTKHFFGEILDIDCDEQYCQNHQPYYRWKAELQQMVLEKYPLKYLEKFLKD